MPAAKPYLLLINENKSHRTKEELAQRKGRNQTKRDFARRIFESEKTFKGNR